MIPVIILLHLFALLGNLATPHLFLGFRYHLGSIAALIALRLFGTRLGVSVSICSTIPLLIAYRTPLPLAWIPLEPLFIALLTARSRIRNLVIADTLYWPLVAAPLITLINAILIHDEIIGMVTFILMQWVIGITNALVAGLILENMPIRRWLSLASEEDTTPVHTILFNLLMAFILIPSFIMMVIGERRAITVQEGQIDTILSRAVQGISTEIRLAVTRYATALDQLVDRAERGGSFSGNGEFASSSLAICREIPEIILVHAYNEQHALIFPHQESPLQQFGATHRKFLDTALSTDKLTIDSHLHLVDERFPSLSIGKRFIDADGSLGVIIFDINPSAFIPLLTRGTDAPPHQAVLTDGERKAIAGSTPEIHPGAPFSPPIGVTLSPPVNGPPLPEWYVPGSRRSQDGLFVRTTAVGHGIPWHLTISIPARESYHALLEEHLTNLAGMLSLSILSLLVSLLLAARLTAPLRKLSLMTSTIVHSLPTPPPSEWPRSPVLEIAQLIATFRSMTDTLVEKFEELESINHTLEERVVERTRELTEANAFLSLEIRDRIRAEEERDRTLAALETQLSFQNTLIESIPNPIFFKNREGRYLGCNRSFLDLIGRAREEIMGKTVHEIYPPDLAVIYHAADEELFARGGVQQYETCIGRADDLRNVIFFKATYAGPDEPIAGLVGVILDITERKQAEMKLEALTHELSSKNRELEEIVYAASHDLRSPLVNIQGFNRKLEKSCRRIAELLADSFSTEALPTEIKTLLEESIPKSLHFINASTRKMDSLLSGLLKLSRLGRMPVVTEAIDMNQLISEILSTFQYQIQSTNARIHAGDLPPCWGDRNQVNQLFSNLLDNALKYRHPKRPPVVTLTGTVDGDQVVYQIRDNGIGIAKEHIDKIWTIFHRLDPSTTPGEGLGLAIVKRIVDRNGGTVRLESTPNEGSVFIVTLPAPERHQRRYT
ncbi:MAG: hypothetical protein Fur0034_10310 [Desulfuromonadia bacterium]